MFYKQKALNNINCSDIDGKCDLYSDGVTIFPKYVKIVCNIELLRNTRLQQLLTNVFWTSIYVDITDTSNDQHQRVLMCYR